jgi:hypothetical protein
VTSASPFRYAPAWDARNRITPLLLVSSCHTTLAEGQLTSNVLFRPCPLSRAAFRGHHMCVRKSSIMSWYAAKLVEPGRCTCGHLAWVEALHWSTSALVDL